MATLHIRQVPESLYTRLRSSASRRGTSINRVVIELLNRSPELGGPMDLSEMLKDSEELVASCRVPNDAPSAVELIRADRAAH